MRYLKKQFKPVVLLIFLCSSLPLQTAQIYAATTATESAVVKVVEKTEPSEISQTRAPAEVESFDDFEDNSEQTEQSLVNASASAEPVPIPEQPVEEDTTLASGSAQPAVITTGSASATIQALTEVGTQIVTTTSEATAAALVDQNPTTISFFKSASCTDLASLIDELDITISDDTSIQQLYQLLVTTGDNTVDVGTISTGTASGQVQLVNQINTTLIGDCWSYLDMTVFEERTANIILPSVEAIINKAAVTPFTPATQSAAQTAISVTTTATDVFETSLITNTGNNQASTIKTGTASSTVNTIDTLNRSTIGNNWFYLEIYNPHYWLGELIGHTFDFYKTDSVWYYWEQLSPQSPQTSVQTVLQGQPNDSNTGITVDRHADIQTTIKGIVNTGNNKVATEGAVSTGNASTQVAIRNNINTTLIGNNWYYASINLFAPFSGNIVFPWSQQQGDEIESVETALIPESMPQPAAKAVGGIQIPVTQDTVLNETVVAPVTEYVFTYFQAPRGPSVSQVYAAEATSVPSVLGKEVSVGQLFSPTQLACLSGALQQDSSQASRTRSVSSWLAGVQVFLWGMYGFLRQTSLP